MNKWDKRFLDLAFFISNWSKDPSTKVGAVIVDRYKRIVSLGFNGYPQSIPDDDIHIREKKIPKIIHAEINSLLFAQRSVDGCTMYTTFVPCSQCASAIIQSGIKEVITVKTSPELFERWGNMIEISEEMFEVAEGVKLIYKEEYNGNK